MSVISGMVKISPKAKRPNSSSGGMDAQLLFRYGMLTAACGVLGWWIGRMGRD